MRSVFRSYKYGQEFQRVTLAQLELSQISQWIALSAVSATVSTYSMYKGTTESYAEDLAL